MDDIPETAERRGRTECGLQRLAAFGTLDEQVRHDLQAICSRRAFRSGQTIAEAGTRPGYIGIVGDGILRMQKTLLDGRQHVVGLLVPGDMFGRLFDGAMHFNVEAAIDSEVLTFDRRRFEKIVLDDPALDRLLLLNLLGELDRARDWMVILANPKVRGRLAGFLLLLCSRFRTIDHLVTVTDRVIRVRNPLSRPDVAHLLGTRIESVSRALHALADDGVIDILRPDLIEIRCLDSLLDEVGEPDLLDQATLIALRQNAAE